MTSSRIPALALLIADSGRVRQLLERRSRVHERRARAATTSPRSSRIRMLAARQRGRAVAPDARDCRARSTARWCSSRPPTRSARYPADQPQSRMAASGARGRWRSSPSWQWRFIDHARSGAPECSTTCSRSSGSAAATTFGSRSSTAGSRPRAACARAIGHFRIGTDCAARGAGFRSRQRQGRDAQGADVSTRPRRSRSASRCTWCSITDGRLSPRGHGHDRLPPRGAVERPGGDGVLGHRLQDGRSISVVSRWMPTGRGRAEPRRPTGRRRMTWTQCWDDSFTGTYEYKPWDPGPMSRTSPAA